MTKTLKFGIGLLVILCVILFLVLLIDVPPRDGAAEVPGVPGESRPDGDHSDLVLAVETTLKRAVGLWEALDYQIMDILVQNDGQMAVVWLAAYDPETGELLAREPQLALAILDQDGLWQVLLEDDARFENVFSGSQYAEKSRQGDLISPSEALPKSNVVYGGYYLPWAQGLTKRLTWSVGHTSCFPIYYCTHAFDFADGTMFPIVAAKGGAVFHWKDSCPNNTSTCTNSITLQDRSTDPWTYQIYLHIAQDSIPSALKQVGAPVRRGQYIARADNTGYSTGHHLHFMVVTENTRYFSTRMESVWGVAEDITFRDVTINWHAPTQGGRPRLPYEAAEYGGEGQTHYLSGNQPAFPPTGGLTAPATKTYVTNRNLTVSGWGEDDIAVVKMELLANYDGSWVKIGDDQIDSPFTTTVDLCDTPVPNGPFTLALRVWDFEGNPSPIMTPRKLIKNVECETAGTNPKVGLIRNEGILALPQSGFVSAQVTKGSAGSEIVSVEFWLHPRSWSTGDWVYLGKDTNGSNGWQAPIITAGMPEGSNYTVLAVGTDADGNKGVGVNFQAIVDGTPPWASFLEFTPPVLGKSLTVQWEGGDSLSGLDHYSLAVSVNNGEFQTLESYIPRTTTSYSYPIEEEKSLVFALTAYDKSGNQTTVKSAITTEGYEFPYQILLVPIYSSE